MHLKKFFDKVNSGILIDMLEMYLKNGIMLNGIIVSN